MAESPAEQLAAQLAAARDAAEIRITTAAADVLDAYAQQVRAAVLADEGVPPQLDMAPTTAEWAQLASATLTDVFVAEFLTIWELGTSLVDVLSGPDVPIAAIVGAWEAIRQDTADDYARNAIDQLNGIPAQMQTILHSAHDAGYFEQESPAQIRARVDEAITGFSPGGSGAWRAERIGRTEATFLLAAVQQAQATAAEQALRNSGHPGGLRKQWITRDDERVRHAHAAVHQKIAPIADRFLVGGMFMLAPGDLAGGLDQIVNCRCHLTILGPAGLTAAGGTPMTSRAPSNYLPTVSMRLDHPSSPSYDPATSPALARAAAAKARGAARLASGAPSAELAESELPDGWRGVLAPLDTLSGDGRLIKAAGLRARPYPLPFLAQESLEPGHYGAVHAGALDRVWVEGGNLMGEGRFDLADPEGQRWARRMADGFAGGVSVDLDDVVFSEHFIDRETGEELDPEDAMEILWFGDDPSRIEYQMHMDEWRLIGHTAVYHPAFYQAAVQPVFGYQPSGEIVEIPAERAAAAANSDPGAAASRRAAAASASAALLAAGVPAGPDAPPEAWFEAPTLPGPTPITVDDDGRVFGHIALWNTCHTGSPDVCIAPPRTSNNYALFHTGEVVTREGDRLSVGRMTVGGGHADPWAPVPGAIEHYDETGAVVAIVRATEDAYGIVVAGALHPHATKQQVADFMLSPPSGDWRRVGANLELVAVLSVNTPGYPVTRPRAAASDNRQISLVASGVPPINRHGGIVRVSGTKKSPVAEQYMSAILARSLRRGRLEQLAAQLGPVDVWAQTREHLAELEADSEHYELVLASAIRHGFRG